MENLTVHFINDLCCTIIFSVFSVFIFKRFTNQITLKQSLAQKLNITFQLSFINWQINISLWTCMGHEGWRKNGKPFIRCYIIALRIWDEFNANFGLLYFSCCRSIKVWHFYLKNLEENNNAVHLRLLFTYLHQHVFNIKNHLTLVLRKICPCIFLCIPN